MKLSWIKALVVSAIAVMALSLSLSIAETIPVERPNPVTEDVKCLAKNIYFEARGSTTADQIAVASVTINRLNDGQWGDTICKVVYSKHQFSWTSKSHFVRDESAWTNSLSIALLVVYGVLEDNTKGATHYHRTNITPDWQMNVKHFKKIGAHYYCRMK